MHREAHQRVEEHAVELHHRNGFAIEELPRERHVAREREAEVEVLDAAAGRLAQPRGDVALRAARVGAPEAEPGDGPGLVEQQHRVDELGEPAGLAGFCFVPFGPVGGPGGVIIEVEDWDGGPKRAPALGEGAGYDGLFGGQKGEDLDEEGVRELADSVGCVGGFRRRGQKIQALRWWFGGFCHWRVRIEQLCLSLCACLLGWFGL